MFRRESLRSKRRWGTADDRRPAADGSSSYSNERGSIVLNRSDLYPVRVSAAICRDAALLVVRESRLGVETVNLPGGAPQIGEPLDRAAASEVLEETGYHARATEIAFVAERCHDRWSAPSLEICFYAEVLPAPRRRPSSEDGEQVVEWLPIDRAEVVMHLPRAIFLLTGERGRYILSEDTARAIEWPNHL